MTSSRTGAPGPPDEAFDQIVHCSDERVGLDSVIAIHDTTLGPSLDIPDCVSNAGGLIACGAEVDGEDSKIIGCIENIGHTTVQLLHEANKRRTDTVTVALLLAKARVAAKRSSAQPAAV